MGLLCGWIFAIISIASMEYCYKLQHIQTLTGPDIKNKFGIHIWNQYMDKLTAFKPVCHQAGMSPWMIRRQTDRQKVLILAV